MGQKSSPEDPSDSLKDHMHRRTFLTMALASPLLGQQSRPATQRKPPAPVAPPTPMSPAWTQWGGPHRNFQTEATGLKDSWPAPVRRSSGSARSARATRRRASKTACSTRCTGKPRKRSSSPRTPRRGETLWEHAHADDVPERRPGDGQRSVRDAAHRRRSRVHDRRRRTTAVPRQENRQAAVDPAALGRPHGSRLMYGYASSPIAFRDTVIVPVGGRGKAVMAFQQADGNVAWAKNDFGNVYSSPMLIDVGGLEQLVVADGRRGHRRQSAQRRSAMAGAVQGRLLDRRRDAGLGTRQPAVRLVRVRRRREGDRAAAQRPADDGDGVVELESAAAAPRQRDARSATRSTSRAAARGARRF